MRRTLILSCLALILTLGVALAKANFSGTWTLDTAKSEGLPPSIKAQTMTITQTEDKINIETTMTTDDGEVSDKATYTLDGKDAPYSPKLPNGLEGKGKRMAKWTADGTGIEVKEEATYDTPQGVITVQVDRKWSLSVDGKTLTIDMTINSPQGTQAIKRVLVKK
jgi:hypothetical protein